MVTGSYGYGSWFGIAVRAGKPPPRAPPAAAGALATGGAPVALKLAPDGHQHERDWAGLAATGDQRRQSERGRPDNRLRQNRVQLAANDTVVAGLLSGDDGGGLYNGGIASVTNCTFSSDTAKGLTGGFGGGIYTNKHASLVKLSFSNNQATVGPNLYTSGG